MRRDSRAKKIRVEAPKITESPLPRRNVNLENQTDNSNNKNRTLSKLKGIINHSPNKCDPSLSRRVIISNFNCSSLYRSYIINYENWASQLTAQLDYPQSNQKIAAQLDEDRKNQKEFRKWVNNEPKDHHY